MSKPLIVIADTDEMYLSTIERKLLKELGNRIELEIISDEAYFFEFFSNPKTAEIVAVGERFYTKDLLKHNIANIFLLCEEEDTKNMQQVSVYNIYKYKGIKEIYNELIYRSLDKILADEKSVRQTQVIAWYSAIGGSGKTGLGLGFSSCLSNNHRKVLYINAESIQAFGYYLKNHSVMPTDGFRAIRSDENHIYGNIRPYIRREGFWYIPPFQATLEALNLDYSIYSRLIQGAKESGDYDYIIVDIEAGYSTEKMELLKLADKVLIVLLPDPISLYKTEFVTKNLDLRDSEKYLFICNRYRKENSLQNKFSIQEYVEDTETPMENIEQLANRKGIQKLAYMFS